METTARSWPAEWSTDRAAFRLAVRQLEEAITASNPASTDSAPTGNTPEQSTGSSGITEEILRPEMVDGQPSAPAFTDAQKREMAAMIAEAFRNHGGQGPTPPPNDPPNLGMGNGNGEWKPDDIGYFDPEHDGLANVGAPIVNAGRHVFYRDVYAFVDRLKDMAPLRDEPKLRTALVQCLRGSALIWHSMELSDLEKQLLKNADLDSWYGALIHRFKERTPAALQHLQRERYSMADARQQKNPRLYAQDIFRYAKAAEMPSLYNQLSIAWNNLNWEFRRDIPEPTSTTTMRAFLDQLDSKSGIWFEMARRLGNSGQKTQANSSSSKYERRQTRDGFPQPASGNSASQYFPRPQGWTSYQYQNSAYSRQSSSFDQVKPAVALPSPRQPLQIIAGNTFGSSNQRRSQPNQDAASRNDGRFSRRQQAYVVNEDEDDAAAEGLHDQEENPESIGDYYVARDDLDYYNPEEDFRDTPESFAHIITPSEFVHQCRRCQDVFQSNNLLFTHLEKDHHVGRRNRSLSKPFADKGPEPIKAFLSVTIGTYIIDFNTSSKAKPFADGKKVGPTIISFMVDASKEVGVGYAYRGYSHAKGKVALSRESTLDYACYDTDAGVTCADRIWFKKQAPNTQIRTMATPLKVRNLDTTKHQSFEYAICDLYILVRRADWRS